MTGKPSKVTVHGNPRWRVDWKDAHGKRHEETFKTAAAADARQAIVNAMPKVLLHSLYDPDITVRGYAALWMTSNTPTWKPRTLHSHRDQFHGHIFPFMVGRVALGDMRVRDVEKPHVKAFLTAKRGAGYKANTVRIMFAVLRGMLNEAAEDEVIAASPIAVPGKSIRQLIGAGKKGSGRQAGEPDKVRAMTAAQLHTFLTVAAKVSRRFFPLYLAGARAGLRAGELCGWQMDDLHADGRLADVRRSLGQESSPTAPQPGVPKSYDSIRVVDISKQLGAVLLDIKARRTAVAVARGWRPVPPWFFVTTNGTPYSQRNVLRDMYRVQRIAGFMAAGEPPPFSLHSLRHTFATLHLINGTDRNAIQYVQQQLGHSSIKVTVDVYGSAIRMVDPAAADRLDDIVANIGANGDR